MTFDPNLSTAQNNAMGVLRSWLGDFNLGSLADTVRQWIIDGYTPERVQLEITNTDVFKQEFPEYQTAIKAGNPMTPQDILNYRSAVTATFRNAGLPEGFYDSKEDFNDLISKRLSPVELQTRVNEGYAKAKQAPQEVRDAFGEYFGVQGENMLASFFLDPAKGTTLIDKQLRQAEVGGYGKLYGFDITASDAEKYAARGLGGAQAQQGFQQAFQMNPLAEETMGDTGDITKGELAEAALTGGAAQEKVQRRSQERAAAFKGGSGGAASGKEGLGLGAAR